MGISEGIDVTVGDQLVHPCTLDRQETGSFFIRLGSGDVDRFVRCVDVTAEDDGFAFIPECIDMLEETVVKCQFVRQTLL
jgi:hypothetical protein